MEHSFGRGTIAAALNAHFEDRRTPLHLNPGVDLELQEPEISSPPITLDDPLEFNGIGSRRNIRKSSHFPVICVAGLAGIEHHGKKAILQSFELPENDHRPGYRPSSDLRDVLGDHKIGLEIFEEPLIEGGTRGLAARYSGKRVTHIVLRSEERKAGTFESFGGGGEAQLYIQTPFEASDHNTLIAELGAIGLITPRWEELVNQTGMGIVWAPWHMAASTPSLQA